MPFKTEQQSLRPNLDFIQLLPRDSALQRERCCSFAQARGASTIGKCCGLRTARKLRSHRRDQKWHDKQYKKAHLGTALKASPFGGASHAKGIALEKVEVEAKQPNSAIRKCVRVQLIKNGKKERPRS
uniref:Small ribosomal subunit protein uS12 n=1 Tax=Moschus moschiferus TaxID=68415 RepID=A0A8C6DSX6_MOSMO